MWLKGVLETAIKPIFIKVIILASVVGKNEALMTSFEIQNSQTTDKKKNLNSTAVVTKKKKKTEMKINSARTNRNLSTKSVFSVFYDHNKSIHPFSITTHPELKVTGSWLEPLPAV